MVLPLLCPLPSLLSACYTACARARCACGCLLLHPKTHFVQVSGGAGTPPVHRAPSRAVPCVVGQLPRLRALAGKPGDSAPSPGAFSSRGSASCRRGLTGPLAGLCPTFFRGWGPRTRGEDNEDARCSDRLPAGAASFFLGAPTTTGPSPEVAPPAACARAGPGSPPIAPPPIP